ncbi:efflux RND transporter periplasmic adaptor subunit [Gelidibacter sp.]|uniref:efflux RND transporter periplasmic adaptor subunit n=1 Tax=Gelidibacter sp. TaxID=2018083 RepID=UPI002BBB12C8|nr:efflux RND transporter periplasmic adaptor subunit [Gelidibacter sp.]HUH28624.1 efflux RND transporter periplasmic adaptor subunit [Gelidibacter sp.]
MKLNFKSIKTLAFLTILATLTLASCSNSESKHKATAETIKTPAKQAIVTQPIAQMHPEYELVVSGELEPAEQVSLYAKVNGFVKKLYVDIGSSVKKGQLLAVLEAPEMDQQLISDRSSEQKLHSDYLYAQQNLERLQEAAKTEGAVAAIELDRAKSAMNSAKSAYASSQAQTGHTAQMQKYLQVVAPFNGVITERNVSEGALVGPGSGQPVFRVADEQNLILKIALPEKHAGSVNDGMEVSFTVNSQPGKYFDANLSRSSKMINSQNRAITLEFDVKNEDQNLNGGEYAQVHLKLKRQNPTFWVSPKSILKTQSGLFVLTKNQDNIQRIPIKEGVRLDTVTEIFGKLKEGDSIVQRPTE